MHLSWCTEFWNSLIRGSSFQKCINTCAIWKTCMGFKNVHIRWNILEFCLFVNFSKCFGIGNTLWSFIHSSPEKHQLHSSRAHHWRPGRLRVAVTSAGAIWDEQPDRRTRCKVRRQNDKSICCFLLVHLGQTKGWTPLARQCLTNEMGYIDFLSGPSYRPPWSHVSWALTLLSHGCSKNPLSPMPCCSAQRISEKKWKQAKTFKCHTKLFWQENHTRMPNPAWYRDVTRKS